MTTADPINSTRNYMAVNARHSMPPAGHDGRNGGYAPPPGATAPLPHIDDMVAFPDDINRNQPMKHLLDMAETTLAKSEMGRDFGKPALAFRDYVKASIITIQIIPSHSDYVELKSSRADWNRRHQTLLKRIAQQSEIYEKIKRDIIADNERTGVKPTVAASTQQKAGANALLSSQTASVMDTSSNEPHTNGSPGKAKPTVHPKPQSLAGHAIKPGHARAASAASATSSAQAMSDLAARFANLRGPQPSPGQDPRIKTHHIVPAPSKPAGPRDMPPPRPKVSLDSAIPALPKMPDAIYSPARGSISGESARLPPTTPRGPYSRAGSIVSLNSGTSTPLPQQGNDYFSSRSRSHSRNGRVETPQPPESSFKVPEGDRITPEELFEAMKAKGFSVLIIDVRAREDFDEGHIMSSSTICIDPNILTRPNISADEIAESLVLSPSQEQTQFERRASYDLVVFYDQDSEKIPSPLWNTEDTPLSSLHRALVHLSYGSELRNAPKLLKGGLDAWVDLMGSASLQSTAPPNPKKVSLVRQGPFQRRPSQYLGKPLRPDIVKVWQQAVEIEAKETENATEQAFHRSTESFLRRFPSLSLQESMTSPAIPQQRSQGHAAHSHQVEIFNDLPSPPTRPAPALPRSSYSSLSQTVDDHDMYDHAQTAAAVSTFERTYYTGLNNPHNWCYANSILQSLLASPFFGRLLALSEWSKRYQVPKKDGEKIEQPQLMTKIISNLFQWMAMGKFQTLKASTLMSYSFNLCRNSHTVPQFGGTGQQDAQEFMSFLFDYLHDETNTRRNVNGSIPQPSTAPHARLQAAVQYWANYRELNQSIVDDYWRGLELSTVDCQRCHKQTHTFSTFDLVFAPVGNRAITLEDSFREHNVVNTLDNFACDTCKMNTQAMQTTCFARMPPLLCLSFRRFDFDKSVGDIRKNTSRVTWDFNEIDLTPYFMRTNEGSSDRAFSGPFKYECYAVIVHSGGRTDNGHYYAYVRDSSTHDPYAWFRCEDEMVTRVRIGTGDANDYKEHVFKSGKDTVPYLAFFRRKDN